MRAPLKPPSFVRQLLLLWQLRLQIAINRSSVGQRGAAIISFFSSSGSAFVLAPATFWLMMVPGIAETQIWADFIVRLLSFVTTCVWALWPILSAGVDDHSELSRYQSLPISSFRLMVASMIATVFEPRSFVFYSPLVGAVAAYVILFPPAFPLLTLMSAFMYVLFNAAISRAGLHVMLNVLRQQRSAQLLGGGFVVMLVGAAFIPPVDVSWLVNLNDVGVSAVPEELVLNAVRALGRFPTGLFAALLTSSSHGMLGLSLLRFSLLSLFTVLALAIAWKLLIRFHERAGRSAPQSQRSRTANPFMNSRTLFTTLVVREALDLWHNPRARLLFSVPFVLGILLKLLSARALFEYFLGATCDAWILGSLAIYGAVVASSTFAQNAFGYDGHGFTAFLSSPVKLGDVLRAKNVVHAGAGVALGVAAVAFYLVYFQHGGVAEALAALFSIVTVSFALVTVGNVLSVLFPVKFHTNLKRRDQVPFASAMIGVSGASLAVAPFTFLLRRDGTHGVSALTMAGLALSAVVAVTAYFATTPGLLKLLELRKELIQRAVTRD